MLSIFGVSSAKPLTINRRNFVHVLFGEKEQDLGTPGKHGISPHDLQGLVVGIQRPIAVFKSTEKDAKQGEHALVVLTELQVGGRNLASPIHLTYRAKDGSIRISNRVPSTYAKNSIQGWLKKGLLLGYEREKGLALLLSGNEPNARNQAHQVQDLETVNAGTPFHGAMVYQNDTSVGDLYQSANDQAREDQEPLVREGIVRKPDSETTKVVTIEDGLAPNFERMQDFTSWVKEVLQAGGNILIQSTGQIASFPNTNIKASMKRARKRNQRESYLALREMIQNAEYDRYELAENSAGQDVYYSALSMGGKLYSVKIKLDVVKPEVKERTDSLGDVKYKDHKLAEIEIAPSLYAGFAHSSMGSFRQADDAIRVSLGILRGNVNPSSRLIALLFLHLNKKILIF